jgi:hypothetical protein
MTSALEQIEREVASWPGVVAVAHRFGGREFRVGRRELGHVHGSSQADLPFPVRIRKELIESGKASPHHILPESGWVTSYLRDASDIERVIALFRLNYERPWMTQLRVDEH